MGLAFVILRIKELWKQSITQLQKVSNCLAAIISNLSDLLISPFCKNHFINNAVKNINMKYSINLQ